MALKRGKKAVAAGSEEQEQDSFAGVDEASVSGGAEEQAVQDGFVLNFISGSDLLPETPKEQVRQRIFHEYGLSVDDMQRDFSVVVGGKRSGRI